MRILYLEDEPDIAEGVVELLVSDRYEVVWVRQVDEAFGELASKPFDLALLDVMVAGDDEAGFAVASALRDAGFDGQVMFLTARDRVADRVHGLDIGGDDYLVKPFSFQELRARVRALLRRSSRLKRSQLERGPLCIDLASRSVTWHGETVSLSDREFAMLELFAHEPDRVFRADELLDRLFPNASSGTPIVRVYVGHLRRKLSDDLIATTPAGYRLGVR
jgi:two-component system, OmpR family, response regulator QseB